MYTELHYQASVTIKDPAQLIKGKIWKTATHFLMMGHAGILPLRESSEKTINNYFRDGENAGSISYELLLYHRTLTPAPAKCITSSVNLGSHTV